MAELAIDLAYLAGIVDGEGYIGVKKARRSDSVNALYHERIQVRMVDPAALVLLKATFGGEYGREHAHADNGRPLYCWAVSDRKAALALAALLPYLRVKRAAAENALLIRRSKENPAARLRGGPGRRPMPADVVAEREAIYQRAKVINAGGGDAEYGADAA